MKNRRKWAVIHIPSKDEVSLLSRDLGVSIDYKRLLEQYKELIELLTENSIDVINVPNVLKKIPSRGMFIGDVFKRIGDIYVIGKPRSRGYPTSLVKEFCRDFEIDKILDVSKVPGATLSCGDLVPINGSSVAIGLSYETNNIGIECIVHRLGKAVFIPCKLQHGHLDNFLSIAGEHALVWSKFKGTSLEAWLRAIEFKITYLPISTECSVNILSLNEDIIISFRENHVVNKILSKEGFKIYALSGSEVLKTGGGLQCLVSLI